MNKEQKGLFVMLTIFMIGLLLLGLNGVIFSNAVNEAYVEPIQFNGNDYITETESNEFMCTLEHVECPPHNEIIVEPLVYEPKKNLAVPNKGLTYTDINCCDFEYNSLALDREEFYIDEQGLAREIETNAVLVAMGTAFEKGRYYVVELSNGTKQEVIVQDYKSDLHTDSTRKVTIVGNSIVEPWIDSNVAVEFASLGNSLVKNITVKKIEEI